MHVKNLINTNHYHVRNSKNLSCRAQTIFAKVQVWSFIDLSCVLSVNHGSLLYV